MLSTFVQQIWAINRRTKGLWTDWIWQQPGVRQAAYDLRGGEEDIFLASPKKYFETGCLAYSYKTRFHIR